MVYRDLRRLPPYSKRLVTCWQPSANRARTAISKAALSPAPTEANIGKPHANEFSRIVKVAPVEDYRYPEQ